MSISSSLDRYYYELAQRRIGVARPYMQYYLDMVFKEINLEGKRVLDIGAGAGAYSAYTAIQGAIEVISLEPEAGGASVGFQNQAHELASALGLKQLSVLPYTIQEYEPEGKTFDVIVSANSINHLDEDACIRLHTDEDAQSTYISIFKKIYSMTSIDGAFLITDTARQNVFPLLGIKNPLVTPRMEWKKHQSPYLWSSLLESVGYSTLKIMWRCSNRVPVATRRLTELILDNRLGTFLTTSKFYLRMIKNQANNLL